jgi:hypothetical protein
MAKPQSAPKPAGLSLFDGHFFACAKPVPALVKRIGALRFSFV